MVFYVVLSEVHCAVYGRWIHCIQCIYAQHCALLVVFGVSYTSATELCDIPDFSITSANVICTTIADIKHGSLASTFLATHGAVPTSVNLLRCCVYVGINFLPYTALCHSILNN